MLQTDVEAAFQGDPASVATDEVILAYPFVEAVAVQRLAHILYAKGVPLVPRIMTEWAHSRTGIDIHPGADDRHALLHRPRDRDGHRRDVADRQPRQDLPGRRADRAFARRGGARSTASAGTRRSKTA